MLGFLKRLVRWRTKDNPSSRDAKDKVGELLEDPDDADQLPSPTDEIRLERTAGSSFTAECGHESWEEVSLNVYGLGVQGSNKTLCPDCMIEKARRDIIRCAACGLPVLPGEGVVLYHETSKLPYAHVATHFDGDSIGCLRWECCPSGGFFAGNWCGAEKGFVPADFTTSAVKP